MNKQTAAIMTAGILVLSAAANVFAAPAAATGETTKNMAAAPGAVQLLEQVRGAASKDAADTAAGNFVQALACQVHPSYWKQPIAVGPYTVHVARADAAKGLADATIFDGFNPAEAYRKNELRTQIVRPGPGVPMVAWRSAQRPDGSTVPYSVVRGQAMAVTAILAFGAESSGAAGIPVSVELYDPTSTCEPVAANLTAPWAFHAQGISRTKQELKALLKPYEEPGVASLRIPEPYRPGRIPVVFVHGLGSSPLTWLEGANELRLDPVIASRYQIWFFRYPSGQPIPISAEILRNDLREVVKKLDPKGKDPALRNMVIVGHSMGGILSRLMVTSTGPSVWQYYSEHALENFNLTPDEKDRLHQLYFWDRVPSITRAVFIAAPHRGSSQAVGSIGRLGAKLINTPHELDLRVQGIFLRNMNLIRPHLLNQRIKFPTSIDSLRPDNPFLLSTQCLQVAVPFHSIIADMGVKAGHYTSDGIVPYDSAHLDGAQSEVRIPARHGCLDHRETIAEVSRILRLHLAEGTKTAR